MYLIINNVDIIYKIYLIINNIMYKIHLIINNVI